MKIVSIHTAKTHLSRLIRQALDGEDIVITNRKDPVVRLQVIRHAIPARRFGGLPHLVEAMGESFDAPLDDFADYAPRHPARVAGESHIP